MFAKPHLNISDAAIPSTGHQSFKWSHNIEDIYRKTNRNLNIGTSSNSTLARGGRDGLRNVESYKGNLKIAQGIYATEDSSLNQVSNTLSSSRPSAGNQYQFYQKMKGHL